MGSDLLPELEREVDGCVPMRADGEVVRVFEVVKTSCQIGRTYTELEGELSGLSPEKRIVDERIQSIGFAELLEVSERRMIERASDVWVIIEGLPFLAAERALVQRGLEGREVGVEPLHLEMMVVEKPIMPTSLDHDIVVGQPWIVLRFCNPS